MNSVKLSSKFQLAIPKAIFDEQDLKADNSLPLSPKAI